MEADTDETQKEHVRSVQAKLFYKLGDRELVERETLRISKDEFSKTIEFLLPENYWDFEFEIDWTMKGNKNISSGRQKSKTQS